MWTIPFIHKGKVFYFFKNSNINGNHDNNGLIIVETNNYMEFAANFKGIVTLSLVAEGKLSVGNRN